MTAINFKKDLFEVWLEDADVKFEASPRAEFFLIRTLQQGKFWEISDWL